MLTAMSRAFEKTVKIVNQRGLHARAAAKFVRLAEQHEAEVTVTKDGASVTGTSIMGLLMLSASLHTEIHISASGPHADKALAELAALVERRFDEDA